MKSDDFWLGLFLACGSKKDIALFFFRDERGPEAKVEDLFIRYFQRFLTDGTNGNNEKEI